MTKTPTSRGVTLGVNLAIARDQLEVVDTAAVEERVEDVGARAIGSVTGLQLLVGLLLTRDVADELWEFPKALALRGHAPAVVVPREGPQAPLHGRLVQDRQVLLGRDGEALHGRPGQRVELLHLPLL